VRHSKNWPADCRHLGPSALDGKACEPPRLSGVRSSWMDCVSRGERKTKKKNDKKKSHFCVGSAHHRHLGSTRAALLGFSFFFFFLFFRERSEGPGAVKTKHGRRERTFQGLPTRRNGLSFFFPQNCKSASLCGAQASIGFLLAHCWAIGRVGCSFGQVEYLAAIGSEKKTSSRRMYAFLHKTRVQSGGGRSFPFKLLKRGF